MGNQKLTEKQKLPTIKNKTMKNIFLTGIALSISIATFGWGQTGHRVIGQIAQNHLSDNAKEALWEIMGHESLVEASTLMDEIKSDKKYDYARSWHYVTIPEGKDYHSSEHEEYGDAYKAIVRMKAILKDPNSTKIQKVEAIRMLTHLVGDIHQPLHVGNREDRGGNNVKIKWFYDNSNLHRIWDSEIIDSKQLSYSELSQMVDHSLETEQDILKSTDLDVWVKEAMELRPQIYDIGGADNLSYEYMYKNWGTIKTQLHKGCIRLAAILNEIYG